MNKTERRFVAAAESEGIDPEGFSELISRSTVFACTDVWHQAFPGGNNESGQAF
jgi:hypothetical protein